MWRPLASYRTLGRHYGRYGSEFRGGETLRPEHEANRSGLSWAAVIGGAFATAALALILLMLGVGLGLSSVSPWSPAGASSTAIGVGTIVWLILTQAIAAAMGGYLAGRLRTKWVSIHSDEVYFRDTAHGFFAWAVAIVITAAFLTSAATSIVGAGVMLGGTAAAGAAMARVARGARELGRGGRDSTRGDAHTPGRIRAGAGATAYYTDALLRSDHPPADSGNASRAELGRILAEGVRKGDLSAQDRVYAAQVVAAQTGLSPADADKRVSEVFAQAKAAAAEVEADMRDAADEARRAAAKTSLWLFVALLTGAFCASLAATVGGRQRDRFAVALGPEPTRIVDAEPRSDARPVLHFVTYSQRYLPCDRFCFFCLVFPSRSSFSSACFLTSSESRALRTESDRQVHASSELSHRQFVVARQRAT